MEAKLPEPEKEYHFIQEKVIPRRKNKVKKIAFITVFTLFLAVIFGLLARYAFIRSEGFWIQILGIDVTKRQEITFPSKGPEDVPVPTNAEPSVEPNDWLTDTPTPTPANPAQITPEVTRNPLDPLTENNTGDQDAVTIVEQKIEATLTDYEKILYDIKKVANSANYGLATVTVIKSSAEWSEEDYETRKTTTGIILAENNAELLLLTSYEKIAGAKELEVGFAGGYTISAQMWDYDKDYDLAVIAVKLKDFTPGQLDTIKKAQLGESYSISTGSLIIALGQPNGINGSLEMGFITSKGNSYYVMDNRLDILTTDITNYATGDGVIINTTGQIIGLITQTMKGENYQDLNAVVGISRLKPVIEKLANKAERVYFGIVGEDIPQQVLKDFGLTNGAYVKDVFPDSPGFLGGIKQGDIITMIDNYSVTSMANFWNIIGNLPDQQVIKVTIQRKIKQELVESSLEVKVEKKP